MNNIYIFQHQKEDYMVEWEEDEKILTLTFSKNGKELGSREIKLLGTIDQQQLDQIVKDYWKYFKNTFLKDTIG